MKNETTAKSSGQNLSVGDQARAFTDGATGTVKELRPYHVGGKQLGTTVVLEYKHRSNDPRRANDPILTTGEYPLDQVSKV